MNGPITYSIARPERLAGDIHFSLLDTLINDKENEVLRLWTLGPSLQLFIFCVIYEMAFNLQRFKAGMAF
jgi:hypothetical protein